MVQMRANIFKYDTNWNKFARSTHKIAILKLKWSYMRLILVKKSCTGVNIGGMITWGIPLVKCWGYIPPSPGIYAYAGTDFFFFFFFLFLFPSFSSSSPFFANDRGAAAPLPPLFW
jgi:hypothetical protein